jgi:hypothetical protein
METFVEIVVGRPRLPIQQGRLSEIPRHVLRVECLRVVEIQKADALKTDLLKPSARGPISRICGSVI